MTEHARIGERLFFDLGYGGCPKHSTSSVYDPRAPKWVRKLFWTPETPNTEASRIWKEKKEKTIMQTLLLGPLDCWFLGPRGPLGTPSFARSFVRSPARKI